MEKSDGEILPYIEVVINNGKYEMNGSLVNYSYGSLHTLFDSVFDSYHITDKKIESALIFGFGAGNIASIITKSINPGCKITGIENDSKILEYANTYFNLKNFKNLDLVKEDAFKFAHECSAKFDLIVIDLFVENRVPIKAKQIEFLSELKKALRLNGSIFFNKITDTEETKGEGKKLMENMQHIFGPISQYKQVINGIENSIFVHV